MKGWKSSIDLFTSISHYKTMWLYAMFDLPVVTKIQRRRATQFRKGLLKDGFSMLQYSVYIRHCPSKENMEVHIARVKAAIPSAGLTSILSITDKQFSEIKNFWGKVERAKLSAPQQLEFF
jgi:CRISPR-associated protein Cas2